MHVLMVIGGECTLNGLFLLEDKQLFDAHTLIDHANPTMQQPRTLQRHS